MPNDNNEKKRNIYDITLFFHKLKEKMNIMLKYFFSFIDNRFIKLIKTYKNHSPTDILISSIKDERLLRVDK